jgi:hypothetical protein
MAVTDTLRLARALCDKGGFSQEAADATAEALDNAFGDVHTDQVRGLKAHATKRDLTDLATSLRAEITTLATALRTETVALATALREEIAKLKEEIADLNSASAC